MNIPANCLGEVTDTSCAPPFYVSCFSPCYAIGNPKNQSDQNETRQSDAPVPRSEATLYIIMTSMKDCLRNVIVSGRYERCPRISNKQQILTKN